MNIYQPIKINYKNQINKIKKLSWFIIYISVPVSAIFGVVKFFENTFKFFSILIENKAFSIVILIIIFFPILSALIYSIYFGLSLAMNKLKDSYNKNKYYTKILSLWKSELDQNNNIYIPTLKIPTYHYFLQEFVHQSKILKVIHFDIERITSQQNENWNIKLALGEGKDVFYIIYHTDQNEKDKVIHVAMNNIDNGDIYSNQNHRIFNRFYEKDIQFLELYVDEYPEDAGYKILKYSINDEEIKIKDRIEKIKAENLHNLRLEIWSSRINEGIPINLYISIEHLCITWE